MKCRILALAVLLGVAAPNAFAAPISAVESIIDPRPFDLFSRDLQRTWTDSTGFFSFEDNDAAIIANNAIDNDFGITNFSDVSYRHDLSWLSPTPGAFLSATLTIYAWANIGGDDVVFTESVNLGALNNGQVANGLFSTSTFNIDPAVFAVQVADGFLDVTIDKNVRGGFGLLNAFSVYGSKLEVTYEGAAVPEPATMALFGSGLVGLLAARRRKHLGA